MTTTTHDDSQQTASLGFPPELKVEKVNGAPQIVGGAKKALLIGINYKGTKSELRGCVNDVRNMRDVLVSDYGFTNTPDTMRYLTDEAADEKTPAQLPIRETIIESMKWLVRDAKPGDSLVFHFSGHGAQVWDKNGDEHDCHDEVVLPLDHATAGFIVDDEIHDIMVRPLPAGVQLFAIFDSCHSGTALDLPFVYRPDGSLKKPSLGIKSMVDTGLLTGAIGTVAGGPKLGLLMGLAAGAIDYISYAVNRPSKAKQKRTIEDKRSDAYVLQLSGCKDTQTSADTVVCSSPTGAASMALLAVLKEKREKLTLKELLETMRLTLKSQYSQVPQLSASHEISLDNAFYL